MDRESIVTGYLAQKVHIAENDIGLGNNAECESAMERELFEDAARDFVAALGGLVRVGRGAQGNAFPRLDTSEVAAQQLRCVLLYVDLLLELPAVAQLHEFVGIARVAILAAKFAAAVRIDGPGEGHAATAGAAVQQGFR